MSDRKACKCSLSSSESAIAILSSSSMFIMLRLGILVGVIGNVESLSDGWLFFSNLLLFSMVIGVSIFPIDKYDDWTNVLSVADDTLTFELIFFICLDIIFGVCIIISSAGGCFL